MAKSPPQQQHSQNPLLFVSHKHDDAKIAEQVAKFVRSVSGGGVDVFLSSNNEFEGPRVGKELNTELKNALWRAGVVVLVYTSQDKDWSWCMWECGLAEDPRSADTKLVILQCLSDEPNLFKGSVRVQAWESESVKAFAKRFQSPDFFPNLGRPVTGLHDNELVANAQSLYEDLARAIPKEPQDRWAAWPLLQIQLPREVMLPLAEVPATERLQGAREALLKHATIVTASSGMPQLFGQTSLSPGAPLGDLVQRWSEHYEGRSTGWLDTIARQVVDGAKKTVPSLERWERFRSVGGDDEYTPGVGQICSDAASIVFDIYFFARTHMPLVTSCMTRTSRMYYVDLAKKPEEELRLFDMLDELESKNWNRIPVLENRQARYIIHLSMIDRFVRRSTRQEQEIEALSLKDLLQDPEMAQMFAETWEVVSEKSTVADAELKRRERKGCQDVFVTENGGRDEPVLGWLTDRDIAETLG